MAEEQYLEEVLAPIIQMQAQQMESPAWTERPSMEILQNTPANAAYQQQRREILNPAGQESYASLSAKAAVDQMMQAQAEAKKKQELELMQTVSKLDPQLQSAILRRAGVQVPVAKSKAEQQSEQQREQLILKHQLEAPERRARLSQQQQELESRQENRQFQQGQATQMFDLRKQMVLGQQAQQLQKLQEMVSLIPAADPRRKVLEEPILQGTLKLLPQLMANGGAEAMGVDMSGLPAESAPAANPSAPLEGPKITVRRRK